MNRRRTATAGLMLAVVLALAACGVWGSNTGDPLDSTSWILYAYRKTAPVPGTQITARFEEGQVTGSSGCNTYFGAYEVSGSSITIGPVGMTEMACLDPEGAMEQEREYLERLANAQTFRLTDGRLQIFWTDHEALTFVQAE